MKKKKIHIIFRFFQEEIFVLKTFFSLGLKEIFFPPLPNQILNKKDVHSHTLHKSLVHDRIHIQGKTTIHAYNHTYRQSRVTDQPNICMSLSSGNVEYRREPTQARGKQLSRERPCLLSNPGPSCPDADTARRC